MYRRSEFYVSKLDAVREQLEEAVGIFFRQRNLLAAHTLVGAAHQVLTDLSKQKFSLLKPIGTPRARLRHLNTYFNFFKHADKDEGALINFQSDHLTHQLYDCCQMFHQLTGEQPHHLGVYQLWFLLAHPSMFRKGSRGYEKLLKELRPDKTDPTNYEAFLFWATELLP